MPEALALQPFTDDPAALRAAFASFPSGVAAIAADVDVAVDSDGVDIDDVDVAIDGGDGSGAADTSGADDTGGSEPVVLVASSFQVGISLDPPLVLFAVQHTSTSWPKLRQAAAEGRRLGVSVLGEAHDLAARQLASKALQASARFAGVETTSTEGGAKFIHGASVWLECSVHSQFPAGDHDVVLLQVQALGTAPETEPLVWHSSAFRTLTPRPAA